MLKVNLMLHVMLDIECIRTVLSYLIVIIFCCLNLI